MPSTLRLLIAAALLAASSSAAGADVAARTERMPFRECLALLAEVSGELGPTAMRVERSAGVSSARIRAADGDVTLVCRRADETVTLSRSRG